jgi:two-component system, chemotaxis family, chemotaxis protein CheY
MKKVLVVDDSPSVRQQVGAALRQAGYAVEEAADGVDGIAKLGATPGIGLVITDVNMPRMNGLEMLEKVKAGGKNASLPIIVLTTEGKAELVDRAKKAGATAWVIKPFKADLLIAAIKKLLPA